MAQPSRLGNYQLIKKLATGGMAEVWLAKQIGIEGFNRHVVIKRILPHLAEDPEFVQMFLNEAKIAAKFSHPNIAQIFDFGEKDGTYFIAMEFIHGEDLGRLMRKAWSTGQWIARPLAIRIVASACEGLHYAHTRRDENGQPLKVVHRDISPQNILISFDGSVKVVDFGIAKAADQVSMTKSGAIKGKFAYMAPEQAAGKPLDARTDVFALGLVLYELLTGVRPLKRDSELATLQAALECNIEAPSVVAEVPSELDDVVMRALTKAADDRYKDARTFQMALEEFLIGQRLVATSVQVSELMETLFAERLSDEAKLGAPNPQGADSVSASPAVPEPPGWEDRKKPRSSKPDNRRPAEPLTDQANPGEAGPPSEDEPGWEAPPAVQPSRKYSNAPGSTQFARSPSSDNVTRAKPPTQELEQLTGAPPAQRPSRPGVRKSSVSLREAPEPLRSEEVIFSEENREPPEPVTEDPDPEDRPRRTSSGPKVRNAAERTGGMPEAPPRRSRIDVRAPNARKSQILKRPSDDERKAVTSAEERPVTQGRGMGLLVVVLLVAVAGVCALVWKSMGAGKADGMPPVLLTVKTNLRTRVTVIPKNHPDEPIDMGESPIEKHAGAHVQDTVRLINEVEGVDWPVELKYGEPGMEKVIEKTFEKGKLTVKVKPRTERLSVWRNEQKLGEAGLAIDLYEGHHNLELRGDRLRGPVPFEVNIVAHSTTSQEVDVGPYVEK
ncbi:MAG: protein kinase [Myxococcaceae bacterium]|nr:protein kinase [Myxococcaceae bacterium]